MKKMIVLLLALTLTACIPAAGASGSELSVNQKKWGDAKISHYRYQLLVGCFCSFRNLMPVTVEVQDGEVVSIIDVNGEPLSLTDPKNETILKYATLDRLFSVLESDNVQKADSLTVSYDPTYGFPSETMIDYIELAKDDELYLSVSAFEQLP